MEINEYPAPVGEILALHFWQDHCPFLDNYLLLDKYLRLNSVGRPAASPTACSTQPSRWIRPLNLKCSSTQATLLAVNWAI
jgi:hypothetical protein